MSRQSTKRAIAIDKDFELLVKGSQRAVSDLIKHKDLAKVFIVFLHDNLLNDKGDLSEGDRIDLKTELAPLYPQIEQCLKEIADLFNIYNDDLDVWKANFTKYLSENPNVLEEALNKFPKVD